MEQVGRNLKSDKKRLGEIERRIDLFLSSRIDEIQEEFPRAGSRRRCDPSSRRRPRRVAQQADRFVIAHRLHLRARSARQFADLHGSP